MSKPNKIGICGTVSCGKTTLIKALSTLPQFKDYKIATERSKYLRDLGIPLNTDSTYKGQIIFTAERASELIHENLLTDRTVIDVMAFSRLSKSMEYHEMNALEKASAKLIKEYDYIFYISPIGVDIEDNGVRATDPKYRADVDFTIKNILEVYGVKYHIISGSTSERIDSMLKILNL
jgi:nicotinamide riboside kinase